MSCDSVISFLEISTMGITEDFAWVKGVIQKGVYSVTDNKVNVHKYNKLW
jgi:hypothetical protein